MRFGRVTTPAKANATFVSKTLVNVDGDVQRRIVAMFKGQEGDAKDQCDLPLTGCNDPHLAKVVVITQ